MRRPPCYNVETKTDCPRRAAGCAVDCDDWAEYVQERDAEYKKRAEGLLVQNALYAVERSRVKDYYRKLKYRSQRGKIGFK